LQIHKPFLRFIIDYSPDFIAVSLLPNVS